MSKPWGWAGPGPDIHRRWEKKKIFARNSVFSNNWPGVPSLSLSLLYEFCSIQNMTKWSPVIFTRPLQLQSHQWHLTIPVDLVTYILSTGSLPFSESSILKKKKTSNFEPSCWVFWKGLISISAKEDHAMWVFSSIFFFFWLKKGIE